MNKIIITIILLAGVVLTGCATSMKTLPDGRILSATTVSDSPDRSATVVGTYEKTEDGKYVLIQETKPVVGPTVLGQTIVGVTTGVTTQAVGGIFQVKAAKEQCAAGGCGTTILNENAITVGVNTNIRMCGSTPCP